MTDTPQPGAAPLGKSPVPAPAPAYQTLPARGLSPADERLWATLTHAGGIFFWFIPALVMYLIYKGRDNYVSEQSLEALNFQIAIAIGVGISWILTYIWIGYLTAVGLLVASVGFSILAAVAANRGEAFRYPISLRLLK